MDFTPVIESRRAALPKQYVVAAGALPTHIVSNQLCITGYIAPEDNNKWVAPPSWRETAALSGNECKLAINIYDGLLDFDNFFHPQKNKNPKAWGGWKYSKSLKKIIPEFAIFDTADCFQIGKPSNCFKFSNNYTDATGLQIGDQRINVHRFGHSDYFFSVIGKLSAKEWEKLNRNLNRNVSEPCLITETIPKQIGIPIPSKLIELILPTVWSDGYGITKAEALKLPLDQQLEFPTPKHIAEKITLPFGYTNLGTAISFKLEDLKPAFGLKCSEAIWSHHNQILIEPKSILQFPSEPIPCKFRDLPAFLCSSDQHDINKWKRVGIESGATRLFITRGSGRTPVKCFGLKNREEDERITSKLSELHFILGPKCEHEFSCT